MRSSNRPPEPSESDDTVQPQGAGSRWASSNAGPGGHWYIERIDTVPMTPEQYEVAVTTLATLITEWQQNRSSGSRADDQAA
jgi:hypothetical protein